MMFVMLAGAVRVVVVLLVGVLVLVVTMLVVAALMSVWRASRVGTGVGGWLLMVGVIGNKCGVTTGKQHHPAVRLTYRLC